MKKNKKGDFTFNKLASIVLIGITVLALILIGLNIFKEANRDVTVITSCGNMGTVSGSGSGTCAPTCDSSFQKDIGPIGCKKVNGVQWNCCVTLDNLDVGNYGGDAKYNFGILGITLKPKDCEYDPKNLKSGIAVFNCKKDKTVDVIITVKNEGSEQLSLKPGPVLTIDGKATKLEIGQAANVPVSSDSSKSFNLTYSLQLKQTGTYILTPLVKCDTDYCKKTDNQGDGISRMNSNLKLTLIVT